LLKDEVQKHTANPPTGVFKVNSLIILNILMIQIVLVEFLVKKLNSLMN